MLVSQKADFYVDDLVIENPCPISFDCFQLKNRKRTTWGTGRKTSLLFYCYWQEKNPATETISVTVSKQYIADKLKKEQPKRLLPKVTVIFFPDQKLSDLINFPPFKT